MLFVGAVLAQGPRTVSEMIRAAGDLAYKHFSVYHCFWSRSIWSGLVLARVLAGQILQLVTGDVFVVVDDSTERRKGPKVHGVGCHRDAVRSTQKHKVLCFGHKWVVLAILVKFPFATRPWALPVLVLLYRPEKQELAEKKRHRTLIDWARLGIALLARWFPQRKFVLIGDGGYSSIELAAFCAEHNIELVGRLRLDSVLYAPPPPREKGKRGRPALKGKRLKSPQQEAESPDAQWQEAVVTWYGGVERTVRLLTGTGLRYTPGTPPVLVRWVVVRDPQGRLRDECFFSTNIGRSPTEIVALYVGRWSIETTFQESRAHLGLESTRNRVRLAVQRTVPCLFGLFSIIALWYHRHLADCVQSLPCDPWYEKAEPTFADAIGALRLVLWRSGILFKSWDTTDAMVIPRRVWEYACARLARSA